MYKENLPLIRKVSIVIFACLLCIGVCLFCEITAHAEENTTYEYTLKYETYGTYWNSSQDIVITSDTPVVGYYYDVFNDGRPEVNLFTYAEHYGLLNQVNLPCSGTYLNTEVGTGKINSGEVTTFTISTVPTARINELKGSSGRTLDETAVFETTIPIFDSLESVKKYIAEGDDSGQLNKPEVDYSTPHNFSQDVYDPTIPLPELSNINHNGFTLTNQGDYWYDVVVESKLNGISIISTRNISGYDYVMNDYVTSTGLTGDYTFAIDKNWIYNSHYYNFTLAHVASCDSVFDMAALYGQDNAAALLEDFKAWSLEYPAYNNLPSYSWYKSSGALLNYYKLWYLYNAESSSNYLNNGMAETTFYVRYYEFADMNYGQWVKYTYRSGTDSTIKSTVASRPIEVTPNGNVVEGSGLNGTVDNDGNISFGNTQLTTPTDTSTNSALVNMMTGLDQFMDLLEIFKSFVGDLPEFVTFLFGFLPWWLNGMLIAALVIVIVLRVLGR